MKIIVEYQGKQYESKRDDENNAEEISEMFYENLADMNEFKMELVGGGSIVLGKIALQSAVVLFLP